MKLEDCINILLLQLSKKYQFYLLKSYTYKKEKRYYNIKLIIYKYKGEEKEKYKELEFKSNIELINYLKEMV